MKLKKTYSFSLLSSVYLTISLVLIGALIYFLFPEDNKLLRLIIFFPTVFIVVFLIIQYRTEQFIYNRIKKIYDEVSILNDDEFIRASTTTDIDSLSNSVKNYVQGKRIEIKNLTERDSFRKDFLGNVSHELKTPLFTVQGYILTLIEGGVNDKLIRDKYLERANKGVDRLVAIVKDLDMIAKLETEGLKMN
jgi:two-component system phosphate regulon sensor histidine kinase PhoR